MKNRTKISRREFLAFSGSIVGALSLFPSLQTVSHATRSNNTFSTTNETMGRVTANSIILYKKPSESSGFIKTLSRDHILPISKTVIGESASKYNKIWYELDGQGFAHSGFIQPVHSNLNDAVETIPLKGLLTEVTVPYTDGVLHPNWPNSVVYRLYYGTTYWINRILKDSQGKSWYRILDEEGYLFYADAAHLHVLRSDDISPISPERSPDEKRIEVHLDDQIVIAFEKDKPVFMTRAATGAVFNTGNFSTPQGTFTTHRKRPSRHMMDPAGSSYDLPGVPWVTYINDNGVAFHGTYWHNDFGAPRSHGCINLSNEAAKWLYRWTNPYVPLQQNYLEAHDGTQVDIW